MIHESGPWKRELLRDADILERWCAKRSYTERRNFLVERKIFLAAYAIRKLVESHKLTKQIKNQNLKTTHFKVTGKRLGPYNWHRINEFFDMDNAHPASLSPLAISNQIVHSFVFIYFIDDDRMSSDGSNNFPIDGFYVASDWAKEKGLHLVKMDDFISLMREVGNDYANQSHGLRKGDKWKIELSR